MIPCQMEHFLGMILDHHQICSMMCGPKVFFSLEVLDGGKGQRIVLFARRGGRGAYFWFISNKFEFSGRNPVPLSPSRSAHYCVTDHVIFAFLISHISHFKILFIFEKKIDMSLALILLTQKVRSLFKSVFFTTVRRSIKT